MKRALVERIFREAVADCHAGKLVRELPAPPFDVLACGKAAREMAEAAGGHALVVTPKHGEEAAGHPLPDARSEAAGRAALQAAAGARNPVVLISGGASALWCVPAPGLTLADKIDATRALVTSGADIGAINCVRKHLSAIKGGRLAAAMSARSLTCLLLSDVLGDDPSVIGSGPCSPDPSTLAEA